MARPEQRVQAKVILLNARGEILLLKRSDYSYRRAKEWELIGGGVDAGESPEAAASREIREESGLQVPVTTKDLVFAQTRVPEDSQVNVTWITYIASTDDDTVQLSKEHTDFRWATVDSALQTITYDIQLNALRHAQAMGYLT